MIIVSQDKKEVINFENILSVKLFHDDEDNECLYEIYTTVNAPGDNYILLGEYNTEERAKEILKSITDEYQASKIFECTSDIYKNQMAAQYLKAKKEPFVYEMPEE